MWRLRYNGIYWAYIISDIIALVTVFVFLSVVNFSAERFVLILLPIFYILINILYTYLSERNATFITILIRSLAFIRMVLLPLLWTQNIDLTLFVAKSTPNTHYGMAVFLLIYEYFCVRTCMMLYDKRNKSQIIMEDGIDGGEALKPGVHYNIAIFKILVPFLLLLALISIVAFPQLRSNYKTILTLNVREFTSDTSIELSGGFAVRVVDTLFSLNIQLLRIVLPTYVLYTLSVKYRESKIIHVTVLIFTILQFMVLSSTFAEALVADLVFVYFYFQLYPERKARTLLILGASTLGMIIVFFSVRYTVSNGGYLSRTNGKIYYYSQVLNSYFQGIDNISACLNIPSGYRIEGMLGAIIKAIPFNTTIFGNTGLNRLTIYFNQFNNTKGQIIPTIGAGYYCFGTLLAPIYSVIFTYYALKYEDRARQNKDNINFISYFFLAVVFSLGVGAKSPSITLRWLLSWGSFLLIITSLSSKKIDKTDMVRNYEY